MRYTVGLILMMVAGAAFAQVQPKAPSLAVRMELYQQLAYMTDRDFAELTPAEQKVVTCARIGEKIDIQLDYERNGSHGIYNLDALRHAGPDYCRAFLMSIH